MLLENGNLEKVNTFIHKDDEPYIVKKILQSAFGEEFSDSSSEDDVDGDGDVDMEMDEDEKDDDGPLKAEGEAARESSLGEVVSYLKYAHAHERICQA
jgi:hypothetical protein